MATVVLAGGGTAGHIEPALAVARQWMKAHPTDTCIFLGTKSGLENTLVPAAGFQLRTIPKVKISAPHRLHGCESHLISLHQLQPPSPL